MKEKRLLDAFSDVKDEFVEESFLDYIVEQKNWSRSSNKIKYVFRGFAVAAAFIVMLLIIAVPNIEKDEEALFSAQTIGDTVILLDATHELQTKNPWNTSKEIEKLPVYKNLAYVSAAGTPAYFSREELLGKAKQVAEHLDTELIQWSFAEVTEQSAPSDVYQICADTEIAEISIYGNGSTKISFYEGVELPAGYLFSDENTAQEAELLVQYLIEMEEDLLQLEQSVVDCQISYDLQGNHRIYYTAFGTRETEQELLGYCFQKVTFWGDEEGKLERIYYGDVRDAAEYLGEYNIISEDEAKKRFLSGEYEYIGLSSAMYENVTEEDIANVELTYLTGSVCKYYQPYYCFYVASEMNGWIIYDRYYVSALTDEDSVQFLEENPIGN